MGVSIEKKMAFGMSNPFFFVLLDSMESTFAFHPKKNVLLKKSCDF